MALLCTEYTNLLLRWIDNNQFFSYNQFNEGRILQQVIKGIGSTRLKDGFLFRIKKIFSI